MASRYDQLLANVQSMINQNAPISDINGYLAAYGISPAQFRGLVEGPTVSGEIKEFFKGLPSGVINLLESAGVGASALLPEEQEKSVRGYIKEKAASARKPFAPRIGYEDSFGGKLGQAVGSTLPFIATGPFGMAGRIGSAALGASAGAGEARIGAEQAGATGSERGLATVLGAPVGIADIFIREFEIGKTVVTRALASAGIEGATEAAQKVAQNMIAKGVYNPEQPILAGAGEEGAYGAGAGALIRLLVDAAIGRKSRGVRGAPDEGLPAAAPEGKPGAGPTPQLGYDRPLLLGMDPAPGEVDGGGKGGRPPLLGYSPSDTAFNAQQIDLEEQVRAAQEGNIPAEEAVAQEETTAPTTEETVQPEETTPLTEEQRRVADIQARIVSGQPVSLEDAAFMAEMQRGEPSTAQPASELQPLTETTPSPAATALETSEIPGPVTEMPELTVDAVRPITEDDFKAMGVGKTNKKLRAAILGKDLADPVQREEVKEVLTDFANSPQRSARLIEGVNKFLSTPAFAEATMPETRAAEEETADVIESGEPVGETTEPSTAVAEQRGEVPTGGTEASVSGGVDVAGGLAGQPTGGEGVQPAALAGDQSEQAAPETEEEQVAEEFVPAEDAYNKLVTGVGVEPKRAAEYLRKITNKDGRVSADALETAAEYFQWRKGRYKVAEEAGEGMPRATVQKIVDSIVSRWKNAPNIKVVQDIQELPQHLFQQMVQDDAFDAQGLYEDASKTVYLIADNLHSAKDTVTTIIHESLGHFGIQSILGNTYAKVMEDIYNGNAKVREAANARMQKYGEGKHLAVEEVLARMAEKGVYNNAIQRIFNAIRQFIRRIGFNPASVTDGEIRALLANAQRFVVAGGPAREGTAAFANKARYRRKEETLTKEGEEAAAFNERMKNIANEPDQDIDLSLRERLMLHADKFKGFGMKFRQAVVDKDATVKEQIYAKYQNTLRDNLNDILGTIANEQAQEAAGFADQLMQRGGIRMTKDGLWEVYDRTEGGENISLDRVFEVVIENLGKRLGSAKTAVTLTHRALIAQRANELNKRNANLRQQADAAEAKGNTKAAAKLRAQIIAVRASKEEIAAGLEAMEKYPEIKQAYDTFTKYNEGIIDFLVASGRISKAEAQGWKDNIGYVPWTRVEEADNKLAELGRLRSGNVHLPNLPQLDKEGSTKEIRNILDNMVGNTIWAVRSGLKNRAALKTLEQMPGAVELKTQDELDAALANKNTKHLVVYAFRDGERVAFKLDSEVDLPSFSNIIDTAGPILAAFRTAATGLRSFVTHMPTFALSQLSEDTVRAMFLSGVKRPFSLPIKVMKNFTKAVMGGASDIQALGITGAYDGMPEHAMRKARERHGLQERAIWRKAWDKLEEFSLAADMAVRAAIYEQTMEETGDQVLAFHRAKEYINFKTSGNGQSVRILRQVVPFLNAYIQGMDILYRTLQGKGLAEGTRREATALFLTTGMKVAALSALYAMLVGDDDDYKGLDDYERDKNFIIPGTGLKIPVAPEIGFLFKVIPERIMMAIAREGTDRPVDATTFLRGMRDAAVNAYGGMNLTPQAVKPVIEVATNYSFFTGNPIVGISMAGKEVSEQFNDHTSELAKLFGYIGISPMKVDHLLRGYLGTVGGVLLDTTDAVVNPNRMAKPINKLPLISTFMYDDTGRGYKTEFYKFREDVDRVVETVNAFKREGRAEELQKYLTDDKIKLYAMRGIINKVEDRLGDLRKYRNIISHDPNLSASEKREKVDEILKMEKEFLVAYNIPRMKVLAGM